MNRRYPVFSGIFSALIPVPVLVASCYGELLRLPEWIAGAAVVATTGFLLAVLRISRKPDQARILAVVGICGLLILLAGKLVDSPGRALAVASLSIIGTYVIWQRPYSMRTIEGILEMRAADRARAACLTVLGLWLVIWLTLSTSHRAGAVIWFSASIVITLVFLGNWIAASWSSYPVRSRLLASLLVTGLIGGAYFWGNWWQMANVGTLVVAIAATALPRLQPRSEIQVLAWWEPILGHPERLLGATFLGLCLIGTILLALPISSASGNGVGAVDAAFTAVSAVCVTGLVVLDTPLDFTGFGQVVILLLIQLGGLGIMTFSTVAMQLLGRKMSLRQEEVVAGLFSVKDRSRLFTTARTILLLTFAMEFAGACLLSLQFFLRGDPLSVALWRATFTSVSAFCNAGFALQSTNLIPFQRDAGILHVVAILIIAGGLSPVAVLSLTRLKKLSADPISIQIRIALIFTAVLLVVGFFYILTSEWSNALAGMSFWDRLNNAWFQSVTLRTAGFNSVDFNLLRPATITLMIVFMFIGGSPGGTAGGIKTTTLAVLLLSVNTVIRGRTSVTVYGRTIPHRVVYKAAAITTAGVAALLVSLILIQLTQTLSPLVALFEITSALGTVGLSLGGTALLDGVGKGIIILAMFAGRIGPLTLFMFLSHRSREAEWRYPEEEINVG